MLSLPISKHQIFLTISLILLFTSEILCKPSEKLPPDLNFVKLSKSPVYVDKTKFLKIFFNNKTVHNFITCPRRFGKTTMLRMIKTFAQIEVDKNKKKLFWKDTHAYKVFHNLSIGQYPRVMARHLAHYVVITLSLNMDHVKRPNERKLIRFLFKQIVEQYDRYKWIQKGHHVVEEDDLEYMNKVLNNTLNKLEKNLCLYRLAKILHNAYGKTRVIILVDDYDSAFTKLVYQPDFEVNKYYQLLNNLLSRTYRVGRKYIDYVLVTGTSSMSYYIDQSKIKGIVHRPFLEEHPFVSFYGFLERELTPVLDQYDFDEVERFKLKECYNGYTTSSKHRTIYNPNSVRQYLESSRKEISKFWRERFEGRNNYFPHTKEVTKYWTIEDRDFVIFEFLCFYEFFIDISIPANTENAEESNFTLSKTYDENSLDKFIVLVKHILNYLNYDPKPGEKKHIYVPLIRTFAFEHGYFTHSRKDVGFYGVPNCEVRMQVAEKVDKFNTKADPTKFL